MNRAPTFMEWVRGNSRFSEPTEKMVEAVMAELPFSDLAPEDQVTVGMLQFVECIGLESNVSAGSYTARMIEEYARVCRMGLSLRKGQFRISLELLQCHPGEALAIMRGVLVLQTSFDFFSNAIEYQGLSYSFRALDPGEDIPWYRHIAEAGWREVKED